MIYLFTILFFISLLVLVIGLIKPSLVLKPLKLKATRTMVALIFGGATIFFFFLVGMTGEPTTAPQPTEPETLEPQTTQEKEKSTQEIFSEIGQKVSKNSKVTAVEENGGWVVVNNLLFDEEPPFSFTRAKFHARDFIFGVYASGIPIKQAGATINMGGKYLRIFVGANQAKLESPDTWTKPDTEIGPTIFYNWVKQVSTGMQENPANSTYIETNL